MTAWSFSFLSDLKGCPYRAFRKYVKRDLPKETSPALEEGIRVGVELEEYLKTGVRPQVNAFTYDVARRFKERAAVPEQKLGMTKARVAANFWDADVWGRGALDVLIVEGDTALIADWKTGKEWPEHKFQLQVEALLVQCNYPVTYIWGVDVYTSLEKLGPMHDLSGVSGVYSEVCEIMHKAEKCGESGEWPKRQNALCGWCPVKDCEHNRSK